MATMIVMTRQTRATAQIGVTKLSREDSDSNVSYLMSVVCVLSVLSSFVKGGVAFPNWSMKVLTCVFHFLRPEQSETHEYDQSTTRAA